MNYYLDTEFNEGFRKPIKVLPTIGNFNKPQWGIELISIAIVTEDGREYYAISNEFDVEAAWNKYDIKVADVYELIKGDQIRTYLKDTLEIDFLKKQGWNQTKVKGQEYKEYWLRENVLRPIFEENYINVFNAAMPPFTLQTFKYVIEKVGKANKQIAEEVKHFILGKYQWAKPVEVSPGQWRSTTMKVDTNNPTFYGYYADYDWVLLCTLFGAMMDLPKGFPMYCNDLKQLLDEKASRKDLKLAVNDNIPLQGLTQLKYHPDFPKQSREHNALSDARWNKQLHEFLNKL